MITTIMKTTQMTLTELIAHLRELYASATQGEWGYHQPKLFVGRTFIVPDNYTGDHKWICGDVHGHYNACFIVETHNVLPRLLEALETQVKDLETFKIVEDTIAELKCTKQALEVAKKKHFERCEWVGDHEEDWAEVERALAGEKSK